MKTCSDQMYELFTGGCFQEGTGEIGGSGDGVLFLYTPHLHTHMLGFDNHGNTKGF